MLTDRHFPYSSMQEINLDWILTKVKNILRFVPDDGAVGQILRRTAHGAEWSDEQGAGGSVTSVNGMQGAVVLTAADVGALPDTYAAPVDSVNGQIGSVVLDAADVGALPDSTVIPDSTSDLVNDSGFVDAAGAAAAAPVQSVNGQTGAVTISTGITVVETGTTTDTKNRVYNYIKYSDGTVDVYLTGTDSNSFIFTETQTGPFNGMYRIQELVTIPMLTDILWGTASGSNSCVFMSALQKVSVNSFYITEQGITGTANNMWISIYIKGKWQ